MPRRRARRLALLATLACALLPFAAQTANAGLIFAAASLKPALDEVLATPDARATGQFQASYAASSQLARQIANGAPAALFISADQDWMDDLEQRGRLAPGTRSDLLGNALVLIGPDDGTLHLQLVPGVDLAAALGAAGRLAIAEPNSVPAGKYAKSALLALGAWNGVERRAVRADNVRAALNFVVRREATLGIVYRSDAQSEPSVRIIATFPAATHAPIVYPIALIREYDSPQARAMLALLHSPAALAIFRRHGFTAPAGTT